MSDEKQETVAGIVAEMRSNKFDDPRFNIFKVLAARELAREYADRIEAAHKRELDDAIAATVVVSAKTASEVYEPHIKSEPVGNAAKMREALQKIVLLTVKAGKSISCDVACGIIAGTAKCALSAPPRNCDVGTEKEQSARFDAQCRKHMGCLTCPFRAKDGCVHNLCEFEWSQMPYEEKESEVK